MDHLSELNKRFLITILSFLIATIPSWIFYENIIDYISNPLTKIGYSDENLVIHNITEPLQVKLYVVFFVSFYIVLPIVVFNITSFLIPAVNVKYKKISWLLTFLSILLFYYGAYFGYVNIYHGLQFFISLTELSVGLRSQYYIQFLFRFIFLIGLFFQFPIVVAFLIMNGLISSKYLIGKRKEIFMSILIIAAVITPTGDPFSLFLFSIPTYLMFELTVLFMKKRFD